jgi:hypothetical protein
MKKYIKPLSALLILIVIFVTIYAVSQQILRNDADYPQIQITVDAVHELNQGISPKSLTTGYVNLNYSLALFTIIYNKLGQVVSGNGYINGHIPRVPLGVLSDSNNSYYHRVTWQPNSNLRIAAVIASANKYYVLSGRSLKIVEENENHTLLLSFIGGIVSAIILLCAFIIDKLNK